MAAVSKAAQKEWLQAAAKSVSERLQPRISTSRFKVLPKSSIVPYVSNTDGWVVEIGSVRGDRGSALQLWLDRWPRTEDRKLYVCYKSTRADQVLRVAKATAAELGPFAKLGDNAWEFDEDKKHTRLRTPLLRALYGRPIAELYTERQPWSFYGMYFQRSPDYRQSPSEAVIKRCTTLLQVAARSVIGLLDESVADDLEYSAVENRHKVVEHKRRDRSARLAQIAKTRDGFTCRVCEFNFEEVYGALGQGFSEAHHIVALSNLRKSVASTPEDLLAVCANCHRMVHRMKGHSTDIATLRRVVSRRRSAV